MLHELDDLALYGYCPLRYRYKVEWGLPYTEMSVEERYSSLLGRTISGYLATLATGKSQKDAKERAVRTLNRGLAGVAGFGATADVAGGYLLEGHLAFLDFIGRLEPDDEVIGGIFPTSIALGERLALSHSLDGLLMRGSSSLRRLLVVHVSREKSPLWAPRYQPLEFQWALEVVRGQLGYDRGRVGHLVFSPWSPKAPVIRDSVPERAEFRAIAHALAHGIGSKVFFQTPHRERCRQCCYRNICTARHCGHVKPREVKRIKESLR